MFFFYKDWESLKKIKAIEDNFIKDVRNLFKLKKEIDGTTIKDIRYLFRLNKENETMKDRVIKILETFLSMKKKFSKNK